MENKETQLAEAKQTIIQLSTVKAQNTILSDNAEKSDTDSPLMTSAYLPFQRGVLRCSDCFDRLYLKEDSTYETPKIKQFDIQSTKDTVTPTEVSLSLNTHGLEELNTNVKKDILQTNVNGNSKDEIYSAKPTNICLMNYFNQSIDETTQPDDNNEDSEVAIK